jgi:glyoxylase-like metal-dependent hydrolase (beta-lactamase superfamily II)
MIDIYKHTNSVMSSITYIVSILNNPKVWLIDCGDADDIINYLRNNSKSPSGVFLTHTHYDHIYGINELKEVYPDLKIFTSASGTEGLFVPKLNLSFYQDEMASYIYKYKDIVELKEFDRVVLWPNIELNVIETPGHDVSCLTYKIGTYLFTGDAYIPGIKTVASFPKSNKDDADISVQRIIELQEKENLIICSGHFLG